MAGLSLAPSEAQVVQGDQRYVLDYPRLERELDAILGPSPSLDDLHRLYFIFTNAMAQITGGPALPLEPSVLACERQEVSSTLPPRATQHGGHLLL